MRRKSHYWAPYGAEEDSACLCLVKIVLAFCFFPSHRLTSKGAALKNSEECADYIDAHTSLRLRSCFYIS